MKHILKCHEIEKNDFIRADNFTLYDSQEKAYTDFEAGTWCTVMGHNHPAITAVIRKQLQSVMHLNHRYTQEAANQTARNLLNCLDMPDGQCTFLNSGSEVVNLSIIMAKRITGKKGFLTFQDSYLAAFGEGGEKSPENWTAFNWTECKNCSETKSCRDECDLFSAIDFKKLAGFVLEPGSSSGLMLFPPAKLVKNLVEMTQHHKAVFICNEVTTGIGRTGKWFGFQHYEVKPDIVAVGKGLGNGYPISAVALTGNMAKLFLHKDLRYAQSHQNDPLGCTVANEVLNQLKENRLIENSVEKSSFFLELLRQLQEQFPIIKEVRGRGLMIGLELQKNKHHSSESIFRKLLDKGFLVGYHPLRNVIRFYPALTIPKKEIESLVESLRQIFDVI